VQAVQVETMRRELEEVGDVGGAGVAHDLQILVRADASQHMPLEEFLGIDAHGGRAALARAEAHAHAPRREQRIAQQPCIIQRLLCRARAELRDPAHRAPLLARPVLGGLEVLDRGSQARVEVRNVVPEIDATDAAAPGPQAVAHRLPVLSDGRDPRHPRHDDAPAHGLPSASAEARIDEVDHVLDGEDRLQIPLLEGEPGLLLQANGKVDRVDAVEIGSSSGEPRSGSASVS
jgi:hypothetical protein